MDLANFMSAVIVLGSRQILLTIIDLAHRVGGGARGGARGGAGAGAGRSRADLLGGLRHGLLHVIQIQTATKIKAKIGILFLENLQGLLLERPSSSSQIGRDSIRVQ